MICKVKWSTPWIYWRRELDDALDRLVAQVRPRYLFSAAANAVPFLIGIAVTVLLVWLAIPATWDTATVP